jgi:hypothetical protein
VRWEDIPIRGRVRTKRSPCEREAGDGVRQGRRQAAGRRGGVEFGCAGSTREGRRAAAPRPGRTSCRSWAALPLLPGGRAAAGRGAGSASLLVAPRTLHSCRALWLQREGTREAAAVSGLGTIAGWVGVRGAPAAGLGHRGVRGSRGARNPPGVRRAVHAPTSEPGARRAGPGAGGRCSSWLLLWPRPAMGTCRTLGGGSW